MSLFDLQLFAENISSKSAPDTKESQKDGFWPSVHGNGTDRLASMVGKQMRKDVISQKASITSGEVKLIVNQLNKLSGSLGVSTHKLLSTGMAGFTANNRTGAGIDKDLRALRIAFPLKEYAMLCGYDVLERPTNSPEEEQAEAKRIKNQLDNCRRKVKKDIDLLASSSLEWSEKVQGKSKDFYIANIIGGGGVRNGTIEIEFTLSMAEYLINLPLTQFQTALLGIDERNENAYNMGLKMSNHYNNDNNLIRGTAQALKVKTLLAVTNFPDPESPAVKKNGWKSRIKEPFEKALDALTGTLLEPVDGWYYSHSKGVRLTDEEAENFSSFEEWANTLVFFTLKDAPDHTARLEAKETRRKQAQEKRKRRAGKKKNEQS